MSLRSELKCYRLLQGYKTRNALGVEIVEYTPLTNIGIVFNRQHKQITNTDTLNSDTTVLQGVCYYQFQEGKAYRIEGEMGTYDIVSFVNGRITSIQVKKHNE